LQSSIADLLANYDFLAAPPAPVLTQIQAAIRSGQLRVAPRTEQVVTTLSTRQIAGGQAGSR